MKKKFALLSVITCSMLTAALLTGCAKIFDEKELDTLKENISVYCAEAHDTIISYDKYRDAVLLERVIEYRDIYDNSDTADWGHIYSKYQLPDESVIYFDTPLSGMSGCGEMTGDHLPLEPYGEREEYYNAQRDLATAGTSSYYGWDLEKAGSWAYVMSDNSSCTYYFIMD